MIINRELPNIGMTCINMYTGMNSNAFVLKCMSELNVNKHYNKFLIVSRMKSFNSHLQKKIDKGFSGLDVQYATYHSKVDMTDIDVVVLFEPDERLAPLFYSNNSIENVKHILSYMCDFEKPVNLTKEIGIWDIRG